MLSTTTLTVHAGRLARRGALQGAKNLSMGKMQVFSEQQVVNATMRLFYPEVGSFLLGSRGRRRRSSSRRHGPTCFCSAYRSKVMEAWRSEDVLPLQHCLHDPQNSVVGIPPAGINGAIKDGTDKALFFSRGNCCQHGNTNGFLHPGKEVGRRASETRFNRNAGISCSSHLFRLVQEPTSGDGICGQQGRFRSKEEDRHTCT